MSNDLPKLNEVSPNAMLDQLKEMVKNTSTTLTAKILDVINLLEHKDYLPNLKAFASIQQNRLYKVLQEKSKKKKKDTTVKFDFKMLLSFEFSICRGGDAMKEFASMMCIPEKDLAVEHFWIMTELIKAVRSDIIGQMYNLKFESEATSTQKKNVWDMSKEGQGKVRYVGGWAIIKLIYSFKKYITTNCTSCNARVRQEMRKRCKWIDMLESLLLQSANVRECSSYKETLTVTDGRQFRNNALVYINDKAFEFFMELEQKRINTLCHENLNALKGSMLSLGLDSAKSDSQLKQKWIKLFDCDDGNQQDAADILYLKIVDKYFSMGAGQYIRDFRRDYNVTKTEAHRKRVQEKKIVKERRNEKVAIASIKDDSSINRQDSHNQLLAMVTKSADIFETTYTKKEIELLFQAYGLKYCNSWTKTRLNPVLVDTIKAATQFICPELLLSHEH